MENYILIIIKLKVILSNYHLIKRLFKSTNIIQSVSASREKKQQHFENQQLVASLII